MKVYQAINAVQSALAKIGITKSRTNSQGSGYKFRGIDDIFNTISPLLAEHNLCILPRVLSRDCIERLSKSGGALFYITVEVEFDFVSSEDGSKHTVKTFGEAMDSGDKATNKAMSAAYKYAAIQAFAIPTEGDNDTENQTYEIKSTVNENQILDLMAAMDEVSTLKELQEANKAAYKAANGEQAWQAKVIAKKDAKKAQLEAILSEQLKGK